MSETPDVDPVTPRPVNVVGRETVEAWDRAVNENPLPDDDPNRLTFVGAGRPATRAEVLAFVQENDARIARERRAERPVVVDSHSHSEPNESNRHTLYV